VISSRKAPQLVQSGFLDLGRLRVHHMQGGRGPAVLFIHGLGSSGYMEWRRNLEPTATRHRVYAPDLPGYGRTDKPRARYTVPYFARFIERYMDDRGLRSAALIGASLGGRIALEVAFDRPGLVRKLALVNTLGLGRPKVRTAQVMYGLVTIPRVGEAVMGVARDALARYYEQRQEIPASLEAVGVASALPSYGQLELNPGDMVLTVTIPTRGQLVFEPSKDDNGKITWSCSAGEGTKLAYMPQACRR